MAGTELRRFVLQLANACEDAVIEFGEDILAIHDCGHEKTLSLRELPLDKYGYVLTAEQTFDPPTSPLNSDGQGIPYAVYGFGAHMAEIEVDLELGTVRVVKVVAAHDVGRAINPTLIEGQIEGGSSSGFRDGIDGRILPGQG